MRTIRFGGQLEKGDFICISYSNSLTFGWYVGSGINTIQFYRWDVPYYTEEDYKNFLNDASPSKWEIKRYKNGFITKCIHKEFVKVHDWRACKVNPLDVFTNTEDLESFEKSKEVLIKLNFIKQ